MKKGWIFLMLAVWVLSAVGCGQQSPQTSAIAGPTAKETDFPTEQEEPDMLHPIAKLVLENGAEVLMELYPEKAPQTVANFIDLANQGFYDGLTFHRIIANFMVQGGDPDGTGGGGPGYCIEGEFAINGHPENDIAHLTGVVSMARRNRPLNSAGSQFFICVADCDWLDGQYAAFGRVTQGMDAVLAMSQVATDANNRPLEVQRIKTITVDTRGKVYQPPVKLPGN